MRRLAVQRLEVQWRDATAGPLQTLRIALILAAGLTLAALPGSALASSGSSVASVASVASDGLEIAATSEAHSHPRPLPARAPNVALPAPGRSIAAFTQRVPDDLRVGPGFGLGFERGCRCEAPSKAFPTLLADWRPRHDLAFTAGRELGSSTGPGIYGTWTLSRLSDVTLGFRFERTRFRLAPQPGFELGRMGEDQSLPAFAALRFGPAHAFVALIAGAELRGRVRIEDETGGFISERDERPAPFVAVAGRMLF